MANNNINGLAQILQIIAEQQGQNIESALRPRGKIARFDDPVTGFGNRGAGGIAGQYAWEAQKREFDNQAIRDQIIQEELQQEIFRTRNKGKQQKQRANEPQRPGGLAGLFQSFFGKPETTPNAGKPQPAQQQQQVQNPGTYVSYDSRYQDPLGRINKQTGKVFGAQPISPMKKEYGWDWNDMPGGRPQGMLERPIAPEVDPKTGFAPYNPSQAGAASMSALQRQQKMNKTGQKSITYTPKNNPINFDSELVKAPRATIAGKGSKKVTTPQVQGPMNQGPNNFQMGLNDLFNLFQSQGQQTVLPANNQNPFLTNLLPIAPVGVLPQNQDPYSISGIAEHIQSNADRRRSALMRLLSGMFPATNPNYRQDVQQIRPF